MSLILTSITISTSQLPDMLAFYEIIGFQFRTQKVDKGSEVHRALHKGVEFCLYPVAKTQGQSVPSLQLGFQLFDLEKVVARLLEVPGAMSLLDPTDMPDGKKAIVLDPDGHSLELTEGTSFGE